MLNEDKLEPFDQAKVEMVRPAQGVAAAETVREGFEQVSGPLLEAVTVGLHVSTIAEHVLVAVHPLLWVTNTVYALPLFTVIDAVVCPPGLQEYAVIVFPEDAVAPAEMGAVGLLQVID